MHKFENHIKVLDQLILAASKTLSESECAEVQEYADHGEFGLGLTTTVAIFTEERKIASPEVKDLVTELAELTKRDPNPLLDRLAAIEKNPPG
jgi:hypothetical protein